MIKRIAYTLAFIFIIVCFVTGFATDFFKPYKGVDYSPSAPRWMKVTRTYSDFSAASTTNTITIAVIPASAIVHSVIMKHTSSFGGGSLISYTISTGWTGNNQGFINNSNVFTAPASTLFYSLPVPIVATPVNSASTTNVTATATSSVGNLNSATAGSVDIYILMSQLP